MAELSLKLDGVELKLIACTLCWEGAEAHGGVVDLSLAEGDVALLRWLLEDPTVDLYPPGSGRRGIAEEAVRRIGERLRAALGSTEEARRLLERALAPGHPPPVLRISSSLDDALALPWELALSPAGTWLADSLSGLLRLRGDLEVQAVPWQPRTGKLRILLAIARPAEEHDVPYRAIAAKLLERVGDRADVRVVRPGTFRAFERALAQGEFDLVHYDGHGDQGVLAFEDGPVEARKLGGVLARCRVPLFVLNACRSATRTGAAGDGESGRFASVAHALLSAGMRAVVAMGSTVRVSSAVDFFDRFYEELSAAMPVSEACHASRRAVETGKGRGPFDWSIPVLYAREDFTPFAHPAQADVTELLGGAGAVRRSPPSGVFLGRDGDLYRVDRAMDEHARVLVFGVGGIGKTTLMEHLLAWRHRTGGADGVALFSFKASPTIEMMCQALQNALADAHPELRKVFEQPQWLATPLAERLARLGPVFARDPKAFWVLLFDNLETLAGYPTPGAGPYGEDDRAAFRALLSALEGDRCRVLLTARRDEVALLGDGTRRIRIVGVNSQYRLEMLRAYGESFAADQRIRAALEGEESRPRLHELLAVIGGHPLATRVAAYGLRDRSVEDVLASIRGEAERILVPEEEADARSNDLEAVIAAGVAGIAPSRRRALGLVGLFRGRFRRDRFTQLVGHESFPGGILEDRSEAGLLAALRQGESLGLMAVVEGAPGVWEAVPGAQGALERLWREDLREEQVDAVLEHFVRYWAAMAGMFRQALEEGGHAEHAVVFTLTEEGNLRRALERALEMGRWVEAQQVLQLLLSVLPMVGRVKDADHLRAMAIGRVTDAKGEPRDAGNEALVNLWRFVQGDLADRAIGRGDLETASRIHRRIVAALEGMKTDAGEAPKSVRANLAVGYHQLGRVEQERGRLDEAEAWYRKSLEIEEALGNRVGMAGSYHQLGIVEEERGQLDKAEAWCRKSLEIREVLGNRPGMAFSYHQLGIVEQLRGRLDEAEVWYRKSLEILEALSDRPGMAISYHQLGMVEQERGRLDEAEAWYRKSLEIEEALGHRPGMASSYHQLGIAEQLRGQLDEAEAWYRKSLEIKEALGHRPGMAISYHQLGMVEQMRGRLDEAQAWYRKSIEIREAFGDRPGMASSCHQLGTLELTQDRPSEALALFLRALGIYSELQLPEGRTVNRSIHQLAESMGREEFSSQWRKLTGKGVPGGLLEPESAEHAAGESAAPEAPDIPPDSTCSALTPQDSRPKPPDDPGLPTEEPHP